MSVNIFQATHLHILGEHPIHSHRSDDLKLNFVNAGRTQDIAVIFPCKEKRQNKDAK